MKSENKIILGILALSLATQNLVLAATSTCISEMTEGRPVSSEDNGLLPLLNGFNYENVSGFEFLDARKLSQANAIYNADGSLVNEYKIGGEIPNSIGSLLAQGFFKVNFETPYYKNGVLDTNSPFFPRGSSSESEPQQKRTLSAMEEAEQDRKDAETRLQVLRWSNRNRAPLTDIKQRQDQILEHLE